MASAKPKLTVTQLEEYLKCALDPEYFISKYLTVEDKVLETQVPFNLLPHQRTVVKGYQENKKNLVQKYRQGGITSISAAYMAWLLTFNDGYKIAIVADKLNLAEKILRTVAQLVSSPPSWMRRETVINNANEKTFGEEDAPVGVNCELKAFAATPDGLRGFSPNLLFVDEAAYLKFGDPFMTSAKGTMSVNGRMILNSTPNGMDELYYVTYEAATLKKNKWNIIEIFWYEDPRFSIDLCWVKGEDSIAVTEPGKPFVVTPESKLRNAELRRQGYVPRNTWYLDMCAEYNNDLKKIRSEIEGEFVGSGGTMIDGNLLEDQRIRFATEPPVWVNSSAPGDGLLWQYEKPIPGKVYRASLDVSLGGDDYHGFQIWRDDATSLELVLEYNVRMPSEVMAKHVNSWSRDYNNAYLTVDVTGGSGAVVIRELAIMGYPNLHFSEIHEKVKRDMLKGHERKSTDGKVLLPGFLIGANRPVMCELLIRAIEQGWLVIRSPRMLAELKRFIWNQSKNRWDHSRTSHDDLIFACLMMLFAREYPLTQAKKLAREEWMAQAQARAPRTAGDVPPVQYDEQGRPVKTLQERKQFFNNYQADGPVGGRTQSSDRPKFVLPYLST